MFLNFLFKKGLLIRKGKAFIIYENGVYNILRTAELLRIRFVHLNLSFIKLLNELIGLNLNTNFKISLTGNVFSADLIGSDVIFRFYSIIMLLISIFVFVCRKKVFQY